MHKHHHTSLSYPFLQVCTTFVQGWACTVFILIWWKWLYEIIAGVHTYVSH